MLTLARQAPKRPADPSPFDAAAMEQELKLADRRVGTPPGGKKEYAVLLHTAADDGRREGIDDGGLLGLFLGKPSLVDILRRGDPMQHKDNQGAYNWVRRGWKTDAYFTSVAYASTAPCPQPLAQPLP